MDDLVRTSVIQLFSRLRRQEQRQVLLQHFHPRLVRGFLSNDELPFLAENGLTEGVFECMLPYLPREERTFIYLIRAEGSGRAKIGLSTNPFRRLRELQPQAPFPIRLVAFIPGDFGVEAMLHSKFKPERRFGEWFEDTPEIYDEFKCLTTS